MFEEKSCFAAFLRTENFWSKVFLRIKILWTKVFLRTQNVASNPKFLEKSLALHYNGWIKVLPRIQNFDFALHPKCLNKSLSLCPCLNKSLASNPQCLNKCSPTFHSSYHMTYKIRLDNCAPGSDAYPRIAIVVTRHRMRNVSLSTCRGTLGSPTSWWSI